MPRYQQGERVKAARDIMFRDKEIKKNTNGTVTHNQGPRVTLVRVKFTGDSFMSFRVVRQDEICRR